MALFGNSSISGDLYARALGHMLRSYRLYDQDISLANDPEAYERMRRDPVISFALRYRKLLASGADWFLETQPLDDKGRLLIAIFEALLKKIERFSSARFNLSEAVLKGSGWGQVFGEQQVVSIAGLAPAPWWVCTRIRDVDKRRLRQWPVDHPDTTQEITVSGAGSDGAPVTQTVLNVNREWVWQIFRPLQQRWEEIDRSNFVRHVYDDSEFALGYGTGLGNELYTFWWAKENVLQNGLQFVERWAQGLLTVGIETMRDGMVSSTSAAQRQADWLTTAEKVRTRHVIVHDKVDDVKVHAAPDAGWGVAREALSYLDGSMRVAILGGTMATDHDLGGALGGTSGASEKQADATDAIVRYDRVLLEETLTRDLIGLLWERNYPILQALGLTDREPPHIRIRDHQHYDPEIRARVITQVLAWGADVRQDEAYQQVGLTPPAPGEPVIKGQRVAPAPLGSGPPSVQAIDAALAQKDAQDEGETPPDEETPAGPDEGETPDEPVAEKFRAWLAQRDLEQRVLPREGVHVHFGAGAFPAPAPAAPSNVTVVVPEREVNLSLNVPERSVTVNAGDVNVKAPVVNVPHTTLVQAPAPALAPEVHVHQGDVNVEVKGGDKKLTLQRDNFGRIASAESETKPEAAP